MAAVSSSAPADPVVIHGDPWLLVIDKPSGLLSQSGRGPALADAVPARLEPAWGPLRHVRAHWQQRVMVFALLLSLLTHALVLSLQHSLFASRPRAKSMAQSLDVVLVNSRTRSAPVEAQVQAQANLDGGGNTDDG